MSKIERLDKVANGVNPWDHHTVEHLRCERLRVKLLMNEVELKDDQREMLESLCEQHPDLTKILATIMADAISKGWVVR
jgi:hypothetical protein